MNIPKSFQLLGQTIKVKHHKSLYKRHKCHGLWVPMEYTIIIQQSVPGCQLSEEYREQTFYHELTHAILEMTGHEKISARESVVESVSQALYQFMKQANVKYAITE